MRTMNDSFLYTNYYILLKENQEQPGLYSSALLQIWRFFFFVKKSSTHAQHFELSSFLCKLI